MQENTTVCYCLGVTYGDIKKAYEEGHTTVDAIKDVTGAATACGRCITAIEGYVTELAK